MANVDIICAEGGKKHVYVYGPHWTIDVTIQCTETVIFLLCRNIYYMCVYEFVYEFMNAYPYVLR